MFTDRTFSESRLGLKGMEWTTYLNPLNENQKIDD